MEAEVRTENWVLTEEECQLIIRECGDIVSPSGLLGKKIDGYRTSSSTHVLFRERHSERVTAILESLRDKVSRLTNLPRENQEDPQIARYLVGEQYKPHNDFFFPKTDYYDREMQRGGQRVWTVLIYLQPAKEGGSTEFTKLGLNLIPSVGSALVWRNVGEDGELLTDTLHAGRPPVRGEKWVMTFWVRESQFK